MFRLLTVTLFTLLAIPVMGWAQFVNIPLLPEIQNIQTQIEVDHVLDIMKWQFTLPTEPQYVSGPFEGVYLETVRTPEQSLLTSVNFKTKNQVYLLGQIIQKKNSTNGEFEVITLTNDYRKRALPNLQKNQLSPEVILSPFWMYSQASALNASHNEEAYKVAEEVTSLLLLTWRGVKDLSAIIEEFDRNLNEAILLQKELDLKTQEGRHLSLQIDQWIDQGILARQQAVRTGWKRLGGWALLDLITWAPSTVLRPLGATWHAFAGLISKSKYGSVTARLANHTRLKGFSLYEKGIQKPFSWLGMKLGIHALRARVALKLTIFKNFLGGFKLVKNIEAGLASGKYQGIKKFFEPAILRCGFIDTKTGQFDFEKRRLWLLSLFYSLPVSITAQYLERGDHFVEEFDRVLHDVGSSFFSGLTWGRCSADFDKKQDLTVFERWRQRQFFQHLNNYTDTGLTWIKLTADSDGLTDRDFEELKRRYVANFAYTITRGPLVAAISGARNGEMNHRYMELVSAGKQKEALESAAQEFITRYGSSLFSWKVLVDYREGYARPDLVQHKQNELKKEAEHLKRTIEMMQAQVPYSQIPELAP